jgi:hypothetical protein
MNSNTDFVNTTNSATTVASKEVKVEAQPGTIAVGPFMPILSGNYNFSVCETDTSKDQPQKS